MKLPKKLSPGEEAFALHCRVKKLEPAREFLFHPNRMWRFDFAFPQKLIGIEIEGGTWTDGRHSRGSGYEKDLAKYNTAARMGWVILRYTTQMVMSGEAINDVLEVIKG